MRASRRLYATVKSAARYLEPNTPTGLTGLSTHPTPRPTLLLTYNQTLEKLKEIPTSSVYRQSCEALTKQRLAVIEGTKPPGYDEWLVRVQKEIDANPDAYKQFKATGAFVQEQLTFEGRPTWDGMYTRKDARKEGSNTESEAGQKAAYVQQDVEKVDKEEAEGVAPQLIHLEAEPPLTAEQYVLPSSLMCLETWLTDCVSRVSDIENKIGAGLIEEIISVAEGELLLAEEMVASKA